MNHARLTLILLSPSLLSGALAVFLSGIIVTATAWSTVNPSSVLHGYLFGEYGFTATLKSADNPLSALNGALASPAAYNVAVLLFAAFIGLFVYVLLEGIGRVSGEATGHLDEVELVTNADERARMKKLLGLHATLRIIMLATWLIYIAFYVRLLAPFAVELARLDTFDAWSWLQIGSVSASFLLLLVLFHVHVIFLRLLFLRPRLFGLQNIIVGQGGH